LGELQKKIKDRHLMMSPSTQNKLLRIVGEMAKEFPQLTEQDKKDLETYESDRNVYANIQANLNERREKWFVKWLR